MVGRGSKSCCRSSRILILNSTIKKLTTFFHLKVSGSSCFLVNSRFSEYANSFNGGHEPIRDRRLLLHKREALKIAQQIDQKGLTCVPLKIYFNEDGKIKIDIGIGRGKDNRDRRQDIKDREGKRTVARQLKNFNFG